MAIAPPPERKYVPGEGMVYDPADLWNWNFPAAEPAPQISPEGTSTATGIEPQQLAAILYGKTDPVFVGGKMRIGGRIVEDGAPAGSADDPTVSYVASFATCANPAGTRTITEFSLRGRVAWTLADGPLLPGLNVEFRTGTETQLPFASSIAKYGDAAIPYRSHILCCVTGLPLSTFAGIVPFPSVMVEDSTFGDPADGITRNDALETILRYAGLDDDEFEVDVSGAWDFLILPDKVELITFLQSLRKLYVNWTITATDKLRIIEPPGFTIDANITRDNHIAHSMKFIRAEPLTKPREQILKFIDPARDYEQNSATARQELWPYPTTSSIESETIELPVGMSAAQAAVDVNYSLFQKEVSRKQLEYTGMVSLLGHEAGDGIQFADHDVFRFRGRVTETVKNSADWTIDVKAETWLNCNAPVTTKPVFLVDHATADITSDGHTFAGLGIGTAAANRTLVIITGTDKGISPARELASLTIDGTPVTLHEQVKSGTAGLSAEPSVTLGIGSIAWPTGTTANFVMDVEGTGLLVDGFFIAIFAVYGLDSATPHATESNASNASNPSTSINVPNSGVLIGGYIGRGAPIGAAVWTGIGTTEVNEASSGLFWVSAASETGMTSETGRIVTATASATGREALIAGSFA